MERRIELLERRVRRLQVASGLALLGVVALGVLLWLQRPNQQVVRARAFEVVDDGGATVSSLGSEPHGPLLRLRSSAGDAQLVVGVFGPNIGLFVLDGKDKVRMMLAAGKQGDAPTLYFKDGQGRTRLSVGTEADSEGGAPLLVMHDSQGRARLFSRARDEPVFVVRSAAGKSEWGYLRPDLP